MAAGLRSIGRCLYIVKNLETTVAIFEECTDVEEGMSPAVPRGEKPHQTSKNVRTLPEVETTRSDSLSFLPKDDSLGLDRFLALRADTILGTSVKSIPETFLQMSNIHGKRHDDIPKEPVSMHSNPSLQPVQLPPHVCTRCKSRREHSRDLHLPGPSVLPDQMRRHWSSCA